MRLLDRMAKGTLGYLPLMARLSQYCDVFSVGQHSMKTTRVYDRQLFALFIDLSQYEIRLFDQDYDSKLDIHELFRLVLSKIGRRSGFNANRLTQLLRDLVGLNVQEIY
jgi:hypothetical protein